jgi:predicted MFS family arabinose efflux permease
MIKNNRWAVVSLATIMSLRMLGLFMVLPVFSLYANQLAGATPLLIGLAMGIYGLTQALLQIPFGALSDHFGRRKIIAIGLILFALGSLLAAFSHNIFSMILARALQGAGAIGSTVIASIADLTSEKQRTKAMAITGMTIGASFSLAMMLGPLLAAWMNVDGIFQLAVLFSIIALIILFTLVPSAPLMHHTDVEPSTQQFLSLLKQPDLQRLNCGIFMLHIIFTASFVVIPISLQHMAGLHGKQQWWLYLPILFFAFLATLPVIIFAEKKQRVKEVFLGAIVLLSLAEFLLWIFAHHLLLSAISLLLFFTAFSVLEAFLPSLVSRTAPPSRKGTALGIYSCAQFLGIFVGGIAGGWLYGALGLTYVYLFCAALAIFWLAIAFRMKKHHH